MPVINRIAGINDAMVEWRQDIHRHPELAYKEHRTAGKVAELLRSFGVDEVVEGVGGTGVVGRIRNGAGPSVGLRADMDALPIHEQNTCEHASSADGVMHACGHDGHTAMLLGAARYLSETRNFEGDVVLVFQPAEEGFAGAKAMLDDGLFERFPVRNIFGMHNMPGLEQGKLRVAPGPIMAAADNFTVTVQGKGAHGAMPHQSVDPIIAGAAIVQAVQTLVSRTSDPKHTLVISVTQFHAGDAYNVIPDSAELCGTIRYFAPETGEMVRKRFPEVCETVARGLGATANVDYQRGYPPTVNHANETAFAGRVASEITGEAVTTEQMQVMGSEDFSFFLLERPGAYAWIGNGDSASLHNPSYDFNDDNLAIGASFLARIAEDALCATD